jgi:L-alanine-DL-glutamate epimerase-like enolase superfamily enzyme
VEAVRRAVGPGTDLRLDANCAWSEEEALERIAALAAFDIELIEQPVPASDVPALARVRAAARFPVAADEAVADERSALRLLEGGAADVLVLKPAALGGLRPAARIAAAARRAGAGALVTSFLDSALGVSAALHLAASLPEPALAAGLATGDLLEIDWADAPQAERGALPVPSGPGLGVAPDATRLAQLACGETREVRA